MSELGDLLVLLHGARSRTATLRATVRTVRRSPGPEPFEDLARVRLAPADRGNAGDIADELRWLHDPAPIVGLLELGELARGTCAGRATVRVRAIPRMLADGDERPLARLGALGADELQLDVDAERGTLLRVESRFRGEAFAVSEVVEIAFDEEAPAEHGPASRHDLTVEQAVALAPFTVWIPVGVPARWTLESEFAPERELPPAAAHLRLHYRADDGGHDLDVVQSRAGHPVESEPSPPASWREIEREGRRMELRAPADDGQGAQVRLELAGTRILLRSTTLSVDVLADLAAGLLHAPSRPPGLHTRP